jgi:hypothetical protein
MDTTSVAYVLCRIEDDSSLTPISQHEDILTAIAAGGYAVEVEDLHFAYALYAGDPSNGSSTRVASLREGRIGYRLWVTRRGRISPSVEDRLDHDIDELMPWDRGCYEMGVLRGAHLPAMLQRACVRHRAWCVGGMRVVFGHWAGGGLPLP